MFILHPGDEVAVVHECLEPPLALLQQLFGPGDIADVLDDRNDRLWLSIVFPDERSRIIYRFFPAVLCRDGCTGGRDVLALERVPENPQNPVQVAGRDGFSCHLAAVGPDAPSWSLLPYALECFA
jgi:hypothetical protein